MAVTHGAARLWEGFRIQARVIGALLLREVITRYGRHGIGVLWIFLEPMLFTLGITAIWYAIKLHAVSNLPIVEFAVTGYASLLLWRNATNRCVKALEPNLGLMYHRYVRFNDILITRCLLEFVGGTASFVLIIVVFFFLGAVRLPADPLYMVFGWLLLCWSGLALSFIVGALSSFNETVERVWHVVNYLALPTTGALFLVDWLPKHLQELVLWIPMVHGVEMVRHGYWGGTVVTHEAPFFMMASNLVLMLIGLALVKLAERRIELE